MKRVFRYSAWFFALLASACSAAPALPSGISSALDPRGSAAAHIASLWWVMLALSAAVFVLVLVLLLSALLKHRRATSDSPPDRSDSDKGRGWVIRGGIILPLVVLSVTFGYTIYTLAVVENPADQAALRIKITARDWWWEVQYPDQGVTTANEIHIPVGVPVRFELDSLDVIHSFWVPQLHGKMDVIPNRPNFLTLEASQPGTYHGQCAEFCGLQHALMGFMVVAQSKEDFNTWLAAQQQPAAALTDPTAKQGQQVFISTGCVYCHNVNGLNPQGITASTPDLGPDLTHFSSRSTIVGASLANNTSNLAGWVIDAQHIKPGSYMPRLATTISAQDLQTLLAYLQSLR